MKRKSAASIPTPETYSSLQEANSAYSMRLGNLGPLWYVIYFVDGRRYVGSARNARRFWRLQRLGERGQLSRKTQESFESGVLRVEVFRTDTLDEARQGEADALVMLRGQGVALCNSTEKGWSSLPGDRWVDMHPESYAEHVKVAKENARRLPRAALSRAGKAAHREKLPDGRSVHATQIGALGAQARVRKYSTEEWSAKLTAAWKNRRRDPAKASGAVRRGWETRKANLRG